MPIIKKTTVKKSVKTAVKKTTAKIKKPRNIKKQTEPKEIKEVKEIPQEEIVEESGKEKKIKYFEAVGRRKTSTARVRLFTQGKKDILVNEKPYKVYFSKFLYKLLISIHKTSLFH